MAGCALSPAAQADLSEIWDYTARRWGKAQAERYTRDIQATCKGLSRGTLVGLSAEDIRPGYRKIGVGSHVMYYRERAGTLEFVRILHRRMDVSRHI